MRVVGLLLAAVLAVGACGDGDTAEASGTTTTDRGVTTTERSTTSRSAPTTTDETTTTGAGTTPTTEPTSTSGAPAKAPSPTSPAPTAAPTTAPAPPYRSSISTVTAAQLGASYTPGLGCAEPAALRAVDVLHWGDDGGVREGRLIVAADRAEAVAAIFGDLYAARFPMTSIIPVDAFGADDQRSMRANNTSGYNCRTVAGSTKLSNHALGLAIDVNPLVNPYVRGRTVDPPEGAPWADRSAQHPGMIRSGDAVVNAFAARGWKWGGYWSSPDYQHFSTSGT